MSDVFDRAREKMVSEPEDLTDRETDTLEAGEPGLGNFARLRRQAALRERVETQVKSQGTRSSRSAFIDAVLSVIKGAKRDVSAKVAALEQRVAQLEARSEVKWLGTFRHDVQYEAGQIVKWGGSTWIAKMQGIGIVPGDKSPMAPLMWDLFSERGRMGKTGGDRE